MLHSVKHIHLHCSTESACAHLHVLARWTQIPATTKLHVPCGYPLAEMHLAVKGWGRGWLPAVLERMPARLAIMLLVDDSDVDHYFSSVASMSPNQQQCCSHVVWLGKRVTPAGFSRLLSCPQQPPLRLEVDPAAAAAAQPGPYAVGWTHPIELSAEHCRALCGLSAPHLVSLVVSGCGQLTNHDVAMLAGACHALRDLKLLGACNLTDPALYALAAGCRLLEQVQLTHASVTEEGVVVALAMLGHLKRLQVGGMPEARLGTLKGLVGKRLVATRGHLQWVVEGPSSNQAFTAWKRLGV
jgi:hypothetical protein